MNEAVAKRKLSHSPIFQGNPAKGKQQIDRLWKILHSKAGLPPKEVRQAFAVSCHAVCLCHRPWPEAGLTWKPFGVTAVKNRNLS